MDLSSTTQVVVKNGKGEVLGLTHLGTGSMPAASCSFDWIVEELPKERFYVVEVGRRGSLTFSAADLEATAWHVSSSLG